MQIRSLPIYEPTPDEIREACRQIQQSWSEQERRRRDREAEMVARHWTPPRVEDSLLQRYGDE